jgi:TatD DNase family protein
VAWRGNILAMYVDSHCHLAFPDFADRVPELRAAMRAARVDAALVICTTLEEFPAVHALAQAHPELWATVGVHPDNEGVREPSTEDLVALSRDPRVIAIGETGLDYYRLNGRGIDDMAWQRERFRAHIRAAAETGLPMVIHTRSASDDTLSILRDEGAGRVRGVFHCFTETEAVARGALELGFHVSFSGILTFRNAQALRDVARMVPMDRLLIETDSPYLAPVPHRGKTNQPAYVVHVAQQVADIKGIALDDVARQTTRNFEALFGVKVPILPDAEAST